MRTGQICDGLVFHRVVDGSMLQDVAGVCPLAGVMGEHGKRSRHTPGCVSGDTQVPGRIRANLRVCRDRLLHRNEDGASIRLATTAARQ